GLSADLAFYARTGAIEEPRFTYRPEGRVLMDLTRLTQFGFWEGYIRLGDEEISIFPDRTPGTRDRSWGVRPVGAPEGGAPGRPRGRATRVLRAVGADPFRRTLHALRRQGGRRGPALARERQRRPRGPPRRARSRGDGDGRPPGALAFGHPPRERRRDHAHPTWPPAPHRRARSHSHLPDARPRLSRSGMG